jgi:putative polyhydroxyalkanoate system protein
MSDIIIQRAHGMTLKKARAAAEQVAAQLAIEFSIEYVWEGNNLNFHRAGVTGMIAVEKKQVTISAKLNFLLRPLKARIEREIHRFCDEIFGPEST